MNKLPTSDAELRSRLIELHVDVGPINDSTRGLYQKMLRKRLSVPQSACTARKKQRTPEPEKKKRPSRKTRTSVNNQVTDDRTDTSDNEEGQAEMEVGKKDESILETLWSGPRRLWEAGKKALFGDEETEDMDVDMPESSDPESDEVSVVREINGDERKKATVASPSRVLRPANPTHPKMKHRKKYEVAEQPAVVAMDENPVARQPLNLARQPLDAVRGARRAARQKPAENDIDICKQRQGRILKSDWELQPWSVAICRHSDGSEWKLGQGGYGEVFKALKDGVDEVAVKRIKLGTDSKLLGQFHKEVDLISQLRHRHIVQFYGACTQPGCLFMVTELMDFDLYSALHGNDAASYMWTGKYGRSVMRGIASGLNYLHSRSPPVVHRDVKSPNILLLNGVAKIADVGLARARLQTLMTAQREFTPIWSALSLIHI